MGFHKRWITEEALISRYRSGGIAEVESYFGNADAVVTSDDLSHEIVDIYNTPHMDNVEKWNEISYKIAMRSIEIGFENEKKKKTTTTS